MCQLHNDLPFLPERMKIEKVKKLVVNLHDKTKYVIHIRMAKTQGLIIHEKVSKMPRATIVMKTLRNPKKSLRNLKKYYQRKSSTLKHAVVSNNKF